MTDSQPIKVKITVICKHCKRECLNVAIPLPTDQCCAGNDCAWQVEHDLAIQCCSGSASDVTSFSSLPVKQGTPVDKTAREGSVGIIIVGRPGAGKTTVVQKGLFPDCSEVKVVESIKDPQIEIISCNSKGIEYKIVMISNADYNKKADPEAGWRKLYALKDKFPHNVSLILFVYRHGRFTDEEKEMFYFGKQCFQSQASALCATVVTNCEGMTSEAKEKIVEDFKENSNTKELAEFMKKEPGICCISFPDLDKLDPQLQEVYKQEFSASHIALSKLLLDEGNMGIDEVLKQPPQQKSGGRFTSSITGTFRLLA